MKKKEQLMIGWNFPPNNDGITAGANDGAIDTFSGKRLSSIVREVIQNSLDAKQSNSSPVRVSFSAEKVKKSKLSGLSDIQKHLENCVKIARKQKLPAAVKHYEHAIKTIEAAANVNFLCIHDDNTTGLTGPLDKPWGSWFAITKGAGISQKSNSASLGSFGHGSKAPFAYSDTRMVFYLSSVQNKNKLQTRFQGKCILQSHEHPTQTGVYTQGTGFYGNVAGNQPLIDKQVPMWAALLREKFTKDTGTSILVPFSNFNPTHYMETKIIVLANFFYAIMSNELEVLVGDELITRANLQKIYENCFKNLDATSEETDRHHIKQCFESIKTILNYDFHNAQEIPNFGQFIWWIRVGEDVEGRTVGVARQNGMLITRKANGLERFRGTRSFDLFVCVKGDKGSELLKDLENPTHDNFEFDRIRFQKARTSAKKKYKLFTSKIREVVATHAALATSEEEELQALSFLFGGISSLSSDSKNSMERGTRITLNSVASNKGNYRGLREGELDYIEDLFSFRDNNRKGTDQTRLKPQSKAEHVSGKPTNSEPITGKMQVVDAINLRVSHSENKHATLFFDSEITGICQMHVFAVGEHGSIPMTLVAGDEQGNAIEVKLTKGSRHCVDVCFEQDATNFVLEAKLHEV